MLFQYRILLQREGSGGLVKVFFSSSSTFTVAFMLMDVFYFYFYLFIIIINNVRSSIFSHYFHFRVIIIIIETIIMYLVSGIGGSVMSCAIFPFTLSVGASGALLGIYGVPVLCPFPLPFSLPFRFFFCYFSLLFSFVGGQGASLWTSW
jgi:hypothetical protein